MAVAAAGRAVMCVCVCVRAGQTVPDTVFLAHGTELLSVFHLPFMCVH